MKVQAIARYVRLSPLKALPLARRLVGLTPGQALRVTRFNRSKASRIIAKTIESAVANVEKNEKLKAEDFRIESVAIDAGPGLRRFWSRSRGMARPIRKPTSHVKVVLSDE